ncbi:MAG: hypothetical protein ACI9FB_002568 [Candidatus Azotimanducaceae bacterium]|jgi:hypothetical protein
MIMSPTLDDIEYLFVLETAGITYYDLSVLRCLMLGYQLVIVRKRMIPMDNRENGDGKDGICFYIATL